MTAPSPPRPPVAPGRGRRPALVLLAVGLAVIVVAFADTWRSMERVWNGSDTYGHGYVVPAISLWLAWRMRGALAEMPIAFGWFGVPVLGVCAAAWLAGEISGVNSITQVAVVGMVAGWTLLALGHRMAWRLMFPLGFLLFMVPLGEGFEPRLMEWTADATVAWLRLVGVPVYREGLHFMLPTGRWSVVEACSGLRYVIVALLLAMLFAHLNYRRWTRHIVFVAAAVVIALVANWVRAWMIVMIGHLSGMRLGVGEDHVWYGWAFFGLVMVAVFYLGNRWRDVDEVRGATASPARAAPLAQPRGWSAAPTLAALLILSALAAVRPLPDRLAKTQPHAGYAAEIMAAMNGSPRGRLSLEPTYPEALAVARGVVDAGTPVEFYSAYYADQRARSELIAFGNAVLPSNDPVWSIARAATVDVAGVDGRGFAAIEYRVRSGAAEALVWHWYAVAGQTFASPYRVKLATLQAILFGRGDHSSVNVLFTRIDGDERAARGRLSVAAGRLASAAAASTSR